ncbi:hypothetical protein OG727_21405 [Streptomyces caniferus]|uniref:Uncharacterized protein n=1 Tax=Streptomyces caniferus TaxID=285557 RepID=A0ABZ1VQU9_9ACTN|nr:hypothetical protein [Streptomyces caniferus]
MARPDSEDEDRSRRWFPNWEQVAKIVAAIGAIAGCIAQFKR